jgi:hypothetical protein
MADGTHVNSSLPQRPCENQEVVRRSRLTDVEHALVLEVPLHIDRLPGKRAGTEVSIDSRRCRRGLEFDVKDLRGDPLPEVAEAIGQPMMEATCLSISLRCRMSSATWASVSLLTMQASHLRAMARTTATSEDARNCDPRDAEPLPRRRRTHPSAAPGA